MKIGIDARMITKNVTGAGRVVETLLGQLKNYPEHNFIVFHTSAFAPTNLTWPHIKYVRLDIPPSTIKNFLIAGWKIRHYGLDVFYYSFVDVPFFIGTPTIAVVYDLFHMNDKDYFYSGSKLRYLLIKWLTWWRLKFATSLIAISESTVEQIRRLPMMNNKKIFKVELSVYNNLNSSNVDVALPSDIQKQEYILYVGNNRRHKNLNNLLKAFAKASHEIPNYKLVLAGAIDSRYENPINIVNDLNIRNNVIHLGTVSDELLDRLYFDCAYVVVPSLYEGFGLPALEAASRRKAVLSSTAAALREVLGDAGVYSDPYDVEGWAEALVMLARNGQKRDEVAMNCFERSKLFSAERFGGETMSALLETARRI